MLAPADSPLSAHSCPEKDRLQYEYKCAMADVNRAVQVLDRFRMDAAESERLWQFSVEARARSEQVRLELERHIAVHGC